MEIILAVVISFVLTALMGKALIPALVKLKVGHHRHRRDDRDSRLETDDGGEL